MAKIIGIDLGTTNSAVSVYENGEAKIIPNKEGKNTTPSVVAFTKNGDILVGESAKRQSVTNPKNTIYSIKRIMGLMCNEDKAKEAKEKLSYEVVDKNGLCAVNINDTIYTPQELSAKILSKLKVDAEEFLGEKVIDAVITVPAYFNDAQRKATKEAGVISGLNVLRIINEPTAAALAYGSDKKKEENILVFDLGGGTHDVTVMEVGDSVIEVLSTGGDAFLGGDDFDNKIIDFLVQEFKSQNGIDLSKDVMAKQRLKDSAEQVKKELSSTLESEVNLPFITAGEAGPLHMVIKLSRAKYEGLIESLADMSVKKAEEVLKDSGLDKNDIGEIILVGGSTRTPLIREKLKSVFGKDLNNSVNPDEVVAMGAAIQGAVLSGESNEMLLLDVTPLSLGIEVMGGLSEIMIEKGTTIPVNKKKVFSTAEDNQPAVTINVVQGESKLAADNKNLGQFNLEGIPAAPRGVPQIEVSFDIDASGILTVSSTDKGTGKTQSISVSGSSGLSEEEINSMIAEAEKDNERNKEKIELIKQKNELDSIISQVEKQNPNHSVLSEAKELIQKENLTINEIENIKKRLLVQEESVQKEEQNVSKKNEEDIIDAEIE